MADYLELIANDKRAQLLKWTIPEENLRKYERLNPQVAKYEAHDCAINTLFLLDVIDKTNAEMLSLRATFQKRITREEIANMLSDYFQTKYGLKMNFGAVTSHVDDAIKLLLQNLDKDEYTIAMFNRVNVDIGHVVVITKINGQLTVQDPQQQKTHCEGTDLNEWVTINKFISVDFIYSIKKTRALPSKTLTIRRPRMEEPATKRRRIEFIEENVIEDMDIKDPRIKILKWKISKKNIDNWKRLNSHLLPASVNDCVINVFNLLGIINRELAEEVAAELAVNKINIYEDQAINKLFNYYLIEEQKRVHFKKIRTKSIKDLKKILNNFDENEYTFIVLNFNPTALWPGINGHLTIITKQNNQLIVLDPQTQSIYEEGVILDNYLKKMNIKSIDVMASVKSARPISQSQIRKPREEERPQTKKRRLSDSPATKLLNELNAPRPAPTGRMSANRNKTVKKRNLVRNATV